MNNGRIEFQTEAAVSYFYGMDVSGGRIVSGADGTGFIR